MIEVKWIMREVVHPAGTNVYRREVGKSLWQRVNDLPIQKADTLSPSLTQEIPEAADFFYMADTIATLDLDQVGFMLLNVYAFIILKNQFAKDLGVYIMDDDVLPDITITKTADPTSIPETGGNVTFTFLVTNISLEDATLDSLVDTDFSDLNGQGDCSVPQPLAGSGGTYSCSVTVFLSGDASGPAHDNVVIGTATHPPRRWPDELVDFLRGPGRHKTLFGTGFPLTGHARSLGQLDDLGLEAAVRRDLLDGNSRRIFTRIPDRPGG